ncbi:unnamed protein product, partial [Trichogramma brassicae]
MSSKKNAKNQNICTSAPRRELDAPGFFAIFFYKSGRSRGSVCLRSLEHKEICV